MYDDILLFIKIVNFGGFTQTARQTNIPQPTISRRMKQLEKNLGLTLIKRDSRNLELTPHGKNLYAKFKDHELHNLQLINELYKTEREINGTLNVAIPHGFANYTIDPFIGLFANLYPNLKLNIHYLYRDVNMIKENFDFAIVGHQPQQGNQKIRLIYRSKQIICCTPGYIKKYGLLEHPNEHVKHKILGPIDVSGTRPAKVNLYQESDGKAIPLNLLSNIRINCIMHINKIIESDEFISGTAEEFLYEGLAKGTLIRVLPEYHAGYIEFYLMTNIDQKDVRAIAFKQFLDDCLNKLKEKLDHFRITV